MPSDATWENDPEGTQPRANITFALVGWASGSTRAMASAPQRLCFGPRLPVQIDDYYHRLQGEGFGTLSYFNIFEYGLNIKCPAPGAIANFTPPSHRDDTTWPDANAFLRTNLMNALLQDIWSVQIGHVVDKCQTTWQGGVVFNPIHENYQQFLLDQYRRHMQELPHFQVSLFPPVMDGVSNLELGRAGSG